MTPRENDKDESLGFRRYKLDEHLYWELVTNVRAVASVAHDCTDNCRTNNMEMKHDAAEVFLLNKLCCAEEALRLLK